jgi:hypothetical protein
MSRPGVRLRCGSDLRALLALPAAPRSGVEEVHLGGDHAVALAQPLVVVGPLLVLQAAFDGALGRDAGVALGEPVPDLHVEERRAAV